MEKKFNIKGSVISDLLPGLIGIAFTLLYLWGLAWSFYRHGAIDGVIALFIPPYAVYRGAAFFWEEPAWKDKYETRTEELAMLIAFSSTDDPTYQIESIKHEDRIRNWVEHLPVDERKKLLQASNAFSLALESYLQKSLNNYLKSNSSSLIYEEKINANKEKFIDIRGFSRVWDESIKQADLFQMLMPQEDFIRNSNENYELKAKIIVSNYKSKMESTIKSIFE